MNVHNSIYEIIKQYKTYRNVRKFFKTFGVPRSVQDALIKEAKNRGAVFS